MRQACDHIRQYQTAWPEPQRLPCAFPGCADGDDDDHIALNRHADGTCQTTWYLRIHRDGWWSWEVVLYEVKPLVCGNCFRVGHGVATCRSRFSPSAREKRWAAFGRRVDRARPARERVFEQFRQRERRLTQGAA